MSTRVGQRSDWSIHSRARVHMGEFDVHAYSGRSNRSVPLFVPSVTCLYDFKMEWSNLHDICTRARARSGVLISASTQAGRQTKKQTGSKRDHLHYNRCHARAHTYIHASSLSSCVTHLRSFAVVGTYPLTHRFTAPFPQAFTNLYQSLRRSGNRGIINVIGEGCD